VTETENFERLSNPDPRRAYRIEETPVELARLILAGLDRIISDAAEPDGARGADATD
jgi:hypothetical protein